MDNIFGMNKMKIGERARVTKVCTKGEMRRRFCDLGIIEGTEVECVGKSPSGDPTAFLIRGAVMALRSEDSGGVLVFPINNKVRFGGNLNGSD